MIKLNGGKVMFKLVCTVCGKEHDHEKIQTVSDCHKKPLFVEYDTSKVNWTKESLKDLKGNSMWKFKEMMPVVDDQNIIDLGEGDTPMIKAHQRGSFEGYSNLYIKDEGINPTGSFKARGIGAALSKAKELGVTKVAIPSAGNAAGATAAYAASAGMECYVFMPQDTPEMIVKECVALGANVYLVDGIISDCGHIVSKGVDEIGWFPISTLKEPYRVEGKKTMGYELAIDLDFELPDAIIYPTGGGTGLIGMWKAFRELESMGVIGSERPKMITVQSTGCAPIVRAYESGVRDAGFWDNAATVASGLRVPTAIGDFLILDAINESGGKAISVTDEELLSAQLEMCADQGIFACPEGGATWAAAKKLVEDGYLSKDDKIVLFNTGSGMNYTNVIELDLPVLDPNDPDILKKL
jgi:threonine synthase